MVVYSKESVSGEGLFTSGDGSKFVTVDSNLTDELREEGMINDFLRRYRDLRKRKGLKIDDTVSLRLKIEDEWSTAPR